MPSNQFQRPVRTPSSIVDQHKADSIDVRKPGVEDVGCEVSPGVGGSYLKIIRQVAPQMSDIDDRSRNIGSPVDRHKESIGDVEIRTADMRKALSSSGPVGRRDNLCKIGGGSLPAAQRSIRSTDTFMVEVSLHEISGCPTLGDLAQLVAAKQLGNLTRLM
jgi:hypothetical protein